MPNWCQNRLELTGSKKQIQKIYQIIIKNSNKSLNLLKFLPLPDVAPKGFEEADKSLQIISDESVPDWYKTNWYKYNIYFFGTKWINDIDLTSNLKAPEQLNDDLYSLVLHFETAWSPLNQNFIQKFCEKFHVNLQLTFYEVGVGFFGAAIYKNGFYNELFEDIEFNEIDNVGIEFEDWIEGELDWAINYLFSFCI